MRQCYSNKDFFLSENFLLQSKELLKINLVFRACLLAESLLLKLNRPWLCASNLIISTKTLRKTPIDEYILRKCRLLLEYESIAYFFVRFIFFAFPEVSRNCRWRSHFFTKTQSYSPQNSTKPHHRCFHRMFWNTYTENFGKYPEKRIKCSSNTRLKFLCRYFSVSAQKRKDILWFRHFPKAFANVWLFLLCYRFTK